MSDTNKAISASAEGQSIAPEQISVSRLKYALFLLLSLLFSIGGVILVIETSNPTDKLVGWVCAIFSSLCAAVFIWMEVRPQVIVLDSDGFTVTGGFLRSPQRIPWSDIDKFFVYNLPRTGKMVAFNYVEGRRPNTRLMNINHSLGADGGLARGWPLSPEAMVEKLNGFRRMALEPRS